MQNLDKRTGVQTGGTTSYGGNKVDFGFFRFFFYIGINNVIINRLETNFKGVRGLVLDFTVPVELHLVKQG